MSKVTPDAWHIILLSLPFASIAGPFAWVAIWILVALALSATHPLLGLALAGLWLLRTPFRWLDDGVALGLAGRITGIFDAPVRAEKMREKFITRRSRHWTKSAPKGRGRSPKTYMPWEKTGDDMPDFE